jgi:hypothetical protein
MHTYQRCDCSLSSCILLNSLLRDLLLFQAQSQSALQQQLSASQAKAAAPPAASPFDRAPSADAPAAACVFLPQLHPHELIRVPNPYPLGWTCNVCRQSGHRDLTYHCAACHFDAHASCIQLTQEMGSTRSTGQHEHDVTLFQKAPYQSGGFRCNVCKSSGKGAVWRCDACQWDCHPACMQPDAASTGPAMKQPDEGRNMRDGRSPVELLHSRSQRRVPMAAQSPLEAFASGIIEVPAAPVLHPHYSCDGCAQQPIIGTRFRCTNCYNFDLCQACKDAGDKHPPSHQFQVFTKST